MPTEHITKLYHAVLEEGKTSHDLQSEFPELKKRYWGQHMWARGYFCATVGAVDEETIKHYIEHHNEESPVENFTIDGE